MGCEVTCRAGATCNLTCTSQNDGFPCICNEEQGGSCNVNENFD